MSGRRILSKFSSPRYIAMKQLGSRARCMTAAILGIGMIVSVAGCKPQLEKLGQLFSGRSGSSAEQTYEMKDTRRLKDIANMRLLNGLEEKTAIDSLWSSKGERIPFVIPEDASERLRLVVESFLAEPKLNQIYSYPIEKIKSRISADMSSDGKMLYVVDSDGMIHVVEIDKGSINKSFQSPIEGAYGILADTAGEHIFLLNPSTLVKIALATEKVVGTIDSIPGEVGDFDRALNVDVLAGVTTDKKIFVVDKDFQGVRLLKDYTTEGQHIAIHPEGKYVAGSANGQLMRWYFSESPERVQGLTAHEVRFNYMPVTCDYYADRWFDPFGMHEYQGDFHTDAMEAERHEVGFTTSLQVVDAASCSEDGYTWNAVVGYLMDGSATQKYVLTNMYCRHIGSTYYSEMMPIDAKYITRIWTNRSGSRVAVINDQDIRVLDRARFADAEGSLALWWLSKVLYEGRIDHIEQFAKYVRSHNWPEKKRTGEQIYGQILGALGTEWKWVEQNPERPEAIKALKLLEEWKASGSEMALVASAKRHWSIGWDARGTGWASEITEKGGEEFDRRINLARADLQKVLDTDTPPGAALGMFVGCQMLDSDDINDGLRTVRKCMELYPDYFNVHGYMTNWLYPRWGGVPGAVNDYATKISSLYPQAMQDIVYATVMIEAIDYMPNIDSFGPDEANADLDRLYRGAEQLRSQQLLARHQYESIARVAIHTGNTAKANDYLDEHLLKYPTLSFDGHRTRTRLHLKQRKYDALVESYQAAQKANSNRTMP
jgi:hypothetical protein